MQKFLNDILAQIKDWLAQNYLQLNERKGELILFGSPKPVAQTTAGLGSMSTLVRPSVRNLGVIFDSKLNFDKQVSAVASICFFDLHVISKIKSFLSLSDLQHVIIRA